MKPNRLDDLESYCSWLESKTTALESRQMRYWETFDKERERTRKELRILGYWNIFLSLAVALLLAGRLWQ